LQPQSFAVPEAVRDYYAQQAARASAAADKWASDFAAYAAAHPALAEDFTRRMRGELPADETWVDKLPGNPGVSIRECAD
jgi:transketolase